MIIKKNMDANKKIRQMQQSQLKSQNEALVRRLYKKTSSLDHRKMLADFERSRHFS